MSKLVLVSTYIGISNASANRPYLLPSLSWNYFFYRHIPPPPFPTHTPSVTFTVMSYNVLCDKYATRQMYGYCPTWALTWEYRKSALLKEIQDASPDIIALQVSMGNGEVV